jgi:hypothetical protein
MRVHVDLPMKPQDANDHFRQYARTLFSVPLTLRHLSRNGVSATRGISLDIGKAVWGPSFKAMCTLATRSLLISDYGSNP